MPVTAAAGAICPRRHGGRIYTSRHGTVMGREPLDEEILSWNGGGDNSGPGRGDTLSDFRACSGSHRGSPAAIRKTDREDRFAREDPQRNAHECSDEIGRAHV